MNKQVKTTQTIEQVHESLAAMRPKEGTPSAPTAKLSSGRVRLAEYVFQTHHASIQDGIAYEQIFDPTGAFWSHDASKLKRGDVIWIEPDDETYTAQVKVESSNGRNAAVVSELWKKDRPRASQDDTGGDHYIQYKGPHLRYCVFRKSDNERIKERCETHDDAMTWLALNKRAA